MYRSDKQFMKNPATASARIYIGNIAEKALAPDLEEKFQVHGKILGLVLRRGFGFIQFENESQAQSAIRNEHCSMFFGRKLNVRQAVDKSSNNPQPQPQPQHNPQPPPAPLLNINVTPEINSQPPPLIPPLMAQKTEQPTDILSEIKQPEMIVEDDVKEPENDDKTAVVETEADVQKAEGNAFDKRKRNRRPGPGRNQNSSLKENINREKPKDVSIRDIPSFYNREDTYHSGFVPPPVIDRPERNDCEIIVVSRLLTEYAEYIEKRLKNIGLMVDLLYPNEDVPLGRVLANISSRGCLYAILVMPQNEECRSLTLNILHGIPQEHRNMPVEDAIILITRNFDSYMRGEKTGTNAGTSGTSLITERHPESIQMLLNLLAENRQITAVQYDKLLKYLQERRELQKQFESTEGAGESNVESEPHNKQAELQSRIMNILNKSADEPTKITEIPNQHSKSGPTPLLNDPSVQRALDSLLSGDMFKTIASNV